MDFHFQNFQPCFVTISHILLKLETMFNFAKIRFVVTSYNKSSREKPSNYHNVVLFLILQIFLSVGLFTTERKI